MSRCCVIAEAGVNHNGSLDLARRLVDAAAEAGADAVKFQSFRAASLVSRDAAKAEYQKRTTSREETQFEMLKRLELDEASHRELIARCAERGIEFISTPFDHESLALLKTFNIPRLKISSGDLTNGPLLLACARGGQSLILSTGMSTLAEIREALGVLAFGYTEGSAKPASGAFASAFTSRAGREALRAKVTLLHCTTEYPTPFEEVNLRCLDTMRSEFQLPIGYSDHTQGIAISVAAVARGAEVIEKHFTLDRNLPGPDHRASLEPGELADMVRSIRQVEVALGSSIKEPVSSERKNMTVARKSLVARVPIAAGEEFTEENLTAKRPGSDVSPMRYWNRLGLKASQDYREDDPIG